MSKGASLSDIHDLNVLKIMVKEIDDCYRALRYIHQEYHPINNRFKDYICSPKTNMYQSLHTTVFGENDLLVQAQIRTNEMDEVASFGLATYWNNNGINARDKMQSAIKEKYQFYKTLENIDNTFESNEQFVEIAKKELFAKNIYVYSNKGDVIELPVGSTVIDYAYKISDELGNHFLKAYVNDEEVPKNYKLKDNDIVKIETNSLAMPKEEWVSLVKTDTAKTHILKYTKDNI
jgi:GTP pyrophosphokinase